MAHHQSQAFNVERFIAILTDERVKTPQEVFRRCEAASALAKLGPAAQVAMPALLRTLVVPISVDCALVLRVAAAEALWKVGGRHDVALPFLAWALKDEQWGASRTASRVLGEMGPVAHQAVPDLVRLADRRCTRGPFAFEQFEHDGESATALEPLLAVVAHALGRCGSGIYRQDAHGMLVRLTTHEEADVRMAATNALDRLGVSGV